MRKLARILRGGEGAEIAEAAMVLPLVFMFLLGIVWFGRAFNIYSTITQAAQQGAVMAARPTCATCAAGTGWNDTSFPGDTAVGNAVVSVLQASSIDPGQILPTSPNPGLLACPSPPAPPGGICNPGPYNIWICRAVQLNPTGGAQPVQCGTVVSFQYPFQFFLPFTSLSMQQITLSAQAQSRMEN
jgi:hypothetical protein